MLGSVIIPTKRRIGLMIFEQDDIHGSVVGSRREEAALYQLWRCNIEQKWPRPLTLPGAACACYR
jgi:hypothetical protein